MEQALRMIADAAMARDFASLLFGLTIFITLSAMCTGRTGYIDNVPSI
jgi:hypothetical protein